LVSLWRTIYHSSKKRIILRGTKHVNSFGRARGSWKGVVGKGAEEGEKGCRGSFSEESKEALPRRCSLNLQVNRGSRTQGGWGDIEEGWRSRKSYWDDLF